MSISFKTSGLNVVELENDISFSERATLLERIPKILTPAVVENLPPYFHGVDSVELADAWLTQMLSESRLLLVYSIAHKLIGFLFVHVESDNEVHIGYLLAEEYWGKGLASELLQGFIEVVSKDQLWKTLVGGVDKANVASARLLKKHGFIEQQRCSGGATTYVFTIPRP
ncbi:MAG: GNAT family N-acetyltransferase [Pseudomonadota bacterium]